MSLLQCLFRSFVLCVAALTPSVHATTVQFQTVLGDIEVNLFDKTTPETVKNFLSYVNSGAYTNTLIHRSAFVLLQDGSRRPFVIQGGGYTYPGAMPLVGIKSTAFLKNEPVYSNLRGTLAMAKLSQQPNSATTQWYFNLHDENANILDPDLSNSGGYTVFGKVTDESLPILDLISGVNTFLTGTSSEFPLRDYTVQDYQDNKPVDETNLVLVTNIVILNADPGTADSLNPVKNTLLVVPEEKNESSGGGSMGLLELLLFLTLFRFFRNI